MTDTAVYAAGGVVWRLVEGRLMVLVIHRTAYADVTLPKGKVDPGETLAETAAREIFEETGIRVTLGISVGLSRYRMPNKRQKIVHYWAAEATDAAIRASTFVPNNEIAAIEWVTLKKARARLTSADTPGFSSAAKAARSCRQLRLISEAWPVDRKARSGSSPISE